MADKENLQNVQMILKDLMDTNGVSEYVVFNNEGIPMRYESLSGKWDHARAVHYAGLISDFLQVTRKLILKEGKNIFQTDGDIDYIRLRTKKGTEFIITSDREFTICVIQKCNPNLADDDFLDEGVGAGGTAANEKSAAPGGE